MKSTIRDWAEAERPREKLMRHGVATLSEAELIAILFRSGTSKHNALDLSRLVLERYANDLNELSRADTPALSKVQGIGTVKAVTLLAAIELGRRCRFAEARKKEKVSCSQDAVNLLSPLLRDLQHEEFWIILLNRANAVIDIRPVSKGGISGTVVDPKMIFREALDARASALVLSHNHPSANPRPSESDIQLTRKLREGGKLLEISVLDHVIIAGSGFYSFADEGTL